MLHSDRSWTRRDFVKAISRAGLIGAVPSLAQAAATLNPDTVCISILHTTDLHDESRPKFYLLTMYDYPITIEILTSVGWRAALRKSAGGGGKIQTRS